MRKLFLIILCCASSAFLSAEDQKPNVILITVDTLRADHLSCYGYLRETSPHIDAFAAKSLLFKKCYSHASLTAPSITSLMTGYYPHETTVVTTQSMPDGVTTLAEILKANGYQTAAVVSNFVLRKKAKFNQGFDFYDDTMADQEVNRKLPERKAAKTVDAALAWLGKKKTAPFFLWVHLQDPHGPYTPPSPYNTKFATNIEEPLKHLDFIKDESGTGGIPLYQKLGKSNIYQFYVSQYDGEIGYMDEQLGRLFRYLETSKLNKNSMIIFTADHGEGMGERDFYFAHNTFLFPGLIQVPLIIQWQNRMEVINEAVQHIDIVPTVVSAIGLQNTCRGLDLLSDFVQTQPVFMEIRNLRSVINKNLQLIYDVKKKSYEFFDLIADPEQRQNQIKLREQAKTIAAMKKMMEDFMSSNSLNVKPENAAVDSETQEKLKSLGYAQ